MAKGPYRSESSEDLAVRLRSSGGNLAVIRNVLDASEGRKTSIGKLIARISSEILEGKDFELSISRLPSSKPEPSARLLGEDNSEYSQSAPLDGHVSYDELRETFSAENEILYRWGMSSRLPIDIIAIVLEKWLEKLPPAQKAVLRSDIVNLAALDGEKFSKFLHLFEGVSE